MAKNEWGEHYQSCDYNCDGDIFISKLLHVRCYKNYIFSSFKIKLFINIKFCFCFTTIFVFKIVYESIYTQVHAIIKTGYVFKYITTLFCDMAVTKSLPTYLTPIIQMQKVDVQSMSLLYTYRLELTY